MSALERTTFALAGIALVLCGLAWSGWAAGQRGRSDRFAGAFAASATIGAPAACERPVRAGG
ncbi:MAG: hypothetical protein HXX10_17460 [Rhodoplanes sp.]|uniref:hypothetical protein n=1 Tax=Rhodoplanes sp. TaxID=1968906 RepID=UPI0017ED5B7E|nr:hypothetical protein [Rhodoplanes sp.]NVO15824.1 hypothetical protein [Rhodoplanes sp.]